MKKSVQLIILALVIPLRVQAETSFAQKPCSNAEAWTFSSEIATESKDLFKTMLLKKLSPVRGFSEALAMRRKANLPETKAFSEYWISRALYQSGMYHIAHSGFTAIVQGSVQESTSGIQAAALGCLSEISDRFPSMGLSPAASQRIIDLSTTASADKFGPILQGAAGALIRDQIAADQTQFIAPALKITSGSSSENSLAQGFLSSKKLDHKETIRALTRFFAEPIPEHLQKFKNQAYLLLARAHFSTGHSKEAINLYKKVEKSSNLLSQSLTELAWSYLVSEKYAEAVGTGISLQSGALRSTFTPESTMVMAMALNEICQYPDAVKAMDLFKKSYEQPYYWLNDWTAHQKDLYPLVKQFAQGTSKIPDRLGTEWLKAPGFISRQDEINLFFKEKETAASLGRMGAQEQRKMAKELLEYAKSVKRQYKMAKIQLKPGEALPAAVVANLQKLKDQFITFQRLRLAAPVWHVVLNNSTKRSEKEKTRLVAEINRDLKKITHGMKKEIEKVAENTQMIEIEIYNGATHDIIWQNANPDYKEVAQQLDTQRKQVAASKNWNWGTITVGNNEEQEIWEDELDSFKADVFDNCSNKEKYLTLKRQQVMQRMTASQ